MMKHAIVSTIAGLGVLVLAPCLALSAQAQENLTEQFVQANRLIQFRQYDQAVQALEELLGKLPVDSADVPRLLASLRRACDGARAGTKFVQAVERQLDRVAAAPLEEKARQNLRGMLMQHLGSYYEDRRLSHAAIRSYEEALQLSRPDAAPAIEQHLADMYEQSGQFDKALGIRRRILERDPDNAWARRKTADVLFRLGKVDEGLEMARAGDDPALLREVAQQLYRAKLLPQAEQIARKAAEQDKDGQRLLADILCDQKKFDEALRILEDSFARETGEHPQDWRLFGLSESLAEIHLHRGTLDNAIADAKRKLEQAAEGDATTRSKFNILLHELYKANQNPQESLQSILRYRESVASKGESDYRLAETGRAALQRLIGQAWLDDARALLTDLRNRGIQGEWIDCAEHALLLKGGNEAGAKALMERLQAAVGNDKRKLLALARELQHWNQDEMSAHTCERILALPPDSSGGGGAPGAGNSAAETEAHIHLGECYLGTQRFKEAVEQFDAADAGLAAAGMSLMNEQYFRRMEALARYRAAGDDGDALVALLKDQRPGRCLAAAQLLGQYGKSKHVPVLEELALDAPPELKADLREAATEIRSHNVEATPPPTPISEEELRRRFDTLGKVDWVQADPFQPDARWAAVADKFLALGTLKTGQVDQFTDALEFLADAVPKPRFIAFTKDEVWVGTDRGLFAFFRQSRQWNAYAVDRRFVALPILGLRVQDGLVVVRAEAEGRDRTWQFNPATRAWKELTTGQAR